MSRFIGVVFLLGTATVYSFFFVFSGLLGAAPARRARRAPRGARRGSACSSRPPAEAGSAAGRIPGQPTEHKGKFGTSRRSASRTKGSSTTVSPSNVSWSASDEENSYSSSFLDAFAGLEETGSRSRVSVVSTSTAAGSRQRAQGVVSQARTRPRTTT